MEKRDLKNNPREKRKFFDRHAAAWDSEHGGEKEHLRALVAEMGLKTGDTVVEPGCGTGQFSAVILDCLGSRVKLCGVDNSRQMVEQAEAKGLGPGTSFYHADVADMPFPGGFADAVVCFRAFPHYDDKPGALSEFSRVLKTGGLLVIAHLAGREQLNRFHAGAGGEVAGDMLPDEDGMRQLLAEAGFKLVSLVDRQDRYLLRAVKIGR